jgi:hypothetical protein
MKMTMLEEEAWKIGVKEAHSQKRIVPAAQSVEMMNFIRRNSKKVGDSIPWIAAYNNGVAIEVGVQTVLEM